MSLVLEGKKAEILRSVVAETSENTGRDFFKSLVRSLAMAMDVRYCFVTECLDTPATRVKTLAFWAGDRFADDFDYALSTTPCEAVLGGQACLFGEDIQTLFSEDQDLVTLGAESYAAVPLLDGQRQAVGHLAILHDEPFGTEVPDLALLDLFAARAAAEIGRQRALEELSGSEARLRQVIDLVPHFIFAKDLDGRFILSNQAVAQALGTTVENLIGKTDADFSATAEEVENFRRDDLAVTRSGKAKVVREETVTDADGSVHILQTTKIPFTTADSEQTAVLGVAIDVTEERRLQRRLQSLVEGTSGAFGEAFFRSLVRHLAEALGTRYAVIAEVEGEQVNARAVWAGTDFVECLSYPLAGSPCEDVVKGQARIFRASRLQQLFPESDLMAQLGAESYLGMPLFDAERRPIGILAVLDTAPMEEEEEDSNLLSIFASRAAAELERERIEAQRHKLQAQLLHVQKLESLGVLAGGIAHDFNNLLSAILGNLDLAIHVLGTDSSAAPFLKGIENAAQRSAELAQQMLAYSGKGKFVVEKLNPGQLIEGILPLLSTSISKKAAIELDLESRPAFVEADATQIRQVMMNLIINASDAIGDRPGTIWVSTRLGEIDRPFLDATYLGESLEPGTYHVLEVRDDGCGMDEETRARLFDPFFTTKSTGRGLGLAALLGIVRGHQGAVRVDSEPDQGSTFTILLPVFHGTPTEQAPSVSQEVVVPRPREGCVLFADDEELLREIARSALQKVGFEVLIAEDGQQAIDLFRRRSPEIVAVVLDMMMPELDGLETFRELRRIKPTIKGLLCSGYSDQTVIHSFSEEGLHGFLQKPYRPEQLTHLLGELLDSGDSPPST